MSSNTRINGIEQVEQALRTLAAYEYDVSGVWEEHNQWLLSLDNYTITELDHTWATQAAEPSTVQDHHEDGEYEVLTAARCFSDRQFTLSPGQRDTLREQHGLTPTKDILISNVVTFKGTNVIRNFTIKSTEHIDPRRRRHVLVEAVVSAAKFFETAAARDKEREEQAVTDDIKAVKKGGTPKTTRGRAMQYFE